MEKLFKQFLKENKLTREYTKQIKAYGEWDKHFQDKVTTDKVLKLIPNPKQYLMSAFAWQDAGTGSMHENTLYWRGINKLWLDYMEENKGE
jgi:hypothetical protein